jgi:hypothetical protein
MDKQSPGATVYCRIGLKLGRRLAKMYQVNFKYPDEASVYPKLLEEVNRLCADEGKSCTCSSGYRSLEKQIIINAQVLANNSGSVQRNTGAVYSSEGKCLAAAYGNSNHCYCIAMDIPDEWFKSLTNADLKPYDLVKPMDYEPWHVQLIEHNGITQAQKEAIKNSVLNGRKDENVTIQEFQKAFGLTADGIVGDKTKVKLTEVLQFCQEQLGLNYRNAEEAIRDCMTKPSIWLAMTKTVPYFRLFVMNIVNRMGCRK